jgi:hypothetical protein
MPGEVVKEFLYVVNACELGDVNNGLDKLLGRNGAELGIEVRHQVAGGRDFTFWGRGWARNNIC